MSIKYIVFISPPKQCPHCDEFRAVFSQLPPEKQALFDVRVGKNEITNPGNRFKFDYWPVVFSATAPAYDEDIKPLDENPTNICKRMLGGGFAADTVKMRRSSTAVKTAAVMAVAAWLLLTK
jgi:hypothetical protein